MIGDGCARQDIERSNAMSDEYSPNPEAEQIDSDSMCSYAKFSTQISRRKHFLRRESTNSFRDHDREIRRPR